MRNCQLGREFNNCMENAVKYYAKMKEKPSDGMMWAARLYGPRDLRMDRVPMPPAPQKGQVLLQVTATSICGSDLHTFSDGHIGNIRVESPLTLGHEFAALVSEVGPDARDARDEPLTPGRRVAVDPAMPCHRCEFCEQGHPNLCSRLHFCGTWPDEGCLSDFILMPSRTCIPLPDGICDIEGALLEPLGIGIHAVRLAGINIGESVAVLGSGPIGLVLVQLAQLSGANPIFATDLYPWRLEAARRYGADDVFDGNEDPVKAILNTTNGRGVDIVFEAAYGDETVAQAAEIACLGGRLVLLGITNKDTLTMRASAARRKGLTIKMARRMKHTYPTAIHLALQRKVDLMDMVTHTAPLAKAADIIALNADYRDNVIKAMVLHE